MFPECSFNPRAHVGRDDVLAPSPLPNRSFNPRAHVGRDEIVRGVADARTVSIHAPTWGATSTWRNCLHSPPVSIHAPTWGATGKPVLAPVATSGFNPRAHVGRDKIRRLSKLKKVRFQSTRPRGARQNTPSFKIEKGQVSIHAPTWGATR